MKERKNSGFSLVELIIVIAIMGILVGIMGLGYSYLSNADVKKVTNEINSGLTELKADSTAKRGTSYMHVTQYDGNYYLSYSSDETITPDGSGKKIGSSSITVTCDGVDMTDGTDISFAIRKKDGSFSKGPSQIHISSGNHTDYTIRIVKETGRHYIE